VKKQRGDVENVEIQVRMLDKEMKEIEDYDSEHSLSTLFEGFTNQIEEYRNKFDLLRQEFAKAKVQNNLFKVNILEENLDNLKYEFENDDIFRQYSLFIIQIKHRQVERSPQEDEDSALEVKNKMKKFKKDLKEQAEENYEIKLSKKHTELTEEIKKELDEERKHLQNEFEGKEEEMKGNFEQLTEEHIVIEHKNYLKLFSLKNWINLYENKILKVFLVQKSFKQNKIYNALHL
jgi:hypothetical protein